MCRGRRAQRLQIIVGAQRGLTQGRGALVEEHRMDALHPGGVLGPQIVAGLQQCPALQDDRRRDPAFWQPAPGQQLPQVPRAGLAGLGVPLAAAGEGGVSRSATCAVTPAAASSSATWRQPVHPSGANATSSRPANRASQARRCIRPAGAIWPRFTSPVAVSRQSNVICFRWMSSPPTMGIGTSSSSGGGVKPPREMPTQSIVTRLSWGGLAQKAPASAQPGPMHVIYRGGSQMRKRAP